MSRQESTADAARHRLCSRAAVSSRCSAGSGYRLTAAPCARVRAPRHFSSSPCCRAHLRPRRAPDTACWRARAAVDDAKLCRTVPSSLGSDSCCPDVRDDDGCVDERPREHDPERESLEGYDEEPVVVLPLTLGEYGYCPRVGTPSDGETGPRARHGRREGVRQRLLPRDGELELLGRLSALPAALLIPRAPP